MEISSTTVIPKSYYDGLPIRQISKEADNETAGKEGRK
jgi:hypothetical protein